MPSAREVRNRIRSVKNIAQITREDLTKAWARLHLEGDPVERDHLVRATPEPLRHSLGTDGRLGPAAHDRPSKGKL